MRTVSELARVKGLDPRRLLEWGVRDVPGGGISIAYHDGAGRELYRRTRDAPGGPRFRQPTGTRLVPYGLDRLADHDTLSTL